MCLRDSPQCGPGHPARKAPSAGTRRAPGPADADRLFFRQLAADQKEKAIGIILSGMGSDGTLGLKTIKENLGMAMVQDPTSAKYDGMPRIALNTGLVDYVAAAKELPAKLIQYVNHSPRLPEDRNLAEGELSAAIQKVFVLLRPHGERFFLLQEQHDQPPDRTADERPSI